MISLPGREAPTHLVQAIIKDFAVHFVPQGKLIYARHTESQPEILDHASFTLLGLTTIHPDKLPTVMFYDQARNWLILAEAARPIDQQRRRELAELFNGSGTELVYVTAFSDRSETFQDFIATVEWGTHIWCASDPTHLIHFDGLRFFGPYHLS